MQEKKKRIVFYCVEPFVMIYKMAKIFKEKNYETVLMTMSEKERLDHKLYSKAFDKIICSNFIFTKSNVINPLYMIKRVPSLIRFLISLRTIKPYVIIGTTGNNWQLKLIHKYLFKKKPFIYFPYDILSHFYNSIEDALEYTKPFEVEAERYCFENADGIIHKGAPDELESKDEFIHKDIKLSPLQLSFMPYCLKEFCVAINKNKLSKKDKQLHFAYVGHFPIDPETKKRLHVFLEETFKQGIHSHFYLKIEHLSTEEEKEHIKNLLGPFLDNKLLHLHPKLNPKEIVPEISKYDFGFWIYSARGISEVKNGVGNKLSTYLEAGIPLIYDHKATFLDKLMKSYGLQIYFDESNLRKIKKILEKLDKREIDKKIINARNDFDMDKNFPRLENFIQQVVKNKNKL